MLELAVDSFAGGGGASRGFKKATGRSPSVAINHDALAIQCHTLNHPETQHFTEDIWHVDLEKVTGGRPVGFAWFSPDCKHYSRARGGKPVNQRIRSLAWVAIRQARRVAPRVIVLENVREFADWSPLVPRWICRACDWKGTEGSARLCRIHRACPRCDSRRLTPTEDLVPDPLRKGLTFRRFVGCFRGAGYELEYRSLDAADYGAGTHRKRLFLIARNDGRPIVWPKPSHCNPAKPIAGCQPWKTAAECIDWSLPCRSIFGRAKPLKERTLLRIAHGLIRHVIDDPKPFIVRFRGEVESSAKSIDAPLPTITAGAYANGTANGGHALGLLMPSLLKVNHGGRDHRTNRVDKPLGTTTAIRAQAMMTAMLTRVEHAAVSATGNHAALVYAFLTKYHGNGGQWQRLDVPLHTVDTKDRYSLVTVTIDGDLYAIVDIGFRMLTPRELARAQGFTDDYILPGSNANQVKLIGNSVCPDVAEAIIRANYKTNQRAKRQAVLA